MAICSNKLACLQTIKIEIEFDKKSDYFGQTCKLTSNLNIIGKPIPLVWLYWNKPSYLGPVVIASLSKYKVYTVCL